MSKKIILSPVATGKTTFINNNPLIACGEWLSTFNYYKKGIHMGSTGAEVPSSHPLYKNWENLYKIGVEKFYNSDSKIMIYNCPNHIPWLKNVYNDIKLEIVMVDEDENYKRYIKRLDNHKDSKLTFKELININSSLLNNKWSWQWILNERTEYQRLSDIFDVKIYKTFEEACG